jgi:hypothetical protein
MASTSNSTASGLDRLEGEIISVGRVVRPDDLNDINDDRADAATEALALYMEHKGQTRKLNETNWASLLAQLADADKQSKPLIEKVSITLQVSEGPGEVTEVQVPGPLAKEISKSAGVGDRIVGEGARGEEEFLLEAYDVYKRAAGSGGSAIAPVTALEVQTGEEPSEPVQGDGGASSENASEASGELDA